MPEKTGDLSGVQRLRADLDRLIDAVAELRHAQIEYARTYKRTVAGIAYAETLAIGHRGFDTAPPEPSPRPNPPKPQVEETPLTPEQGRDLIQELYAIVRR